jgi:gliding motility-associated-like protein
VSLDTLLSSLGCDSIVTLRLTVVPDPGLLPTFDLIDPSCSYLMDGSIELVDVSNGNAPIGYFLDTLQRTVGAIVPGLGEGTYQYRLADRYGCTTSGDVSLMTPNPFLISLGPDQAVSLGDAVRLNTGTGDPVATYSFTPAALVNCTTDCEGVTFFPAESTLLTLVATSDAGCVSEDSLRIIVVKDRLVYPPSAFSPNGDGINDRFTLFAATPNVTALARLRIFDRWGGQVFEDFDLAPNDVTAGWDGNLEGEAVPPGTYIYVSDVVFLDGVVERYSGVVVLVR